MVLTGPRQSGKTTLFQQLFGKHCGYVSLEPPDILASANEDPRTFLETHPPPVIFDEVQYAPDLLPYIKEKIDANRDKFGQYFLTGSQNLLMMERITESLAGRPPCYGFCRCHSGKSRVIQRIICPGRKGLDKAMPGYIVHPGDITLPLGDGVTALPFGTL